MTVQFLIILKMLEIDKTKLTDEEAYEKIIDMNNHSDYTTGNFLDYVYYKKHHRLIAIDLSKQTKLKDPQQINFIAFKKYWSNNVFYY